MKVSGLGIWVAGFEFEVFISTVRAFYGFRYALLCVRRQSVSKGSACRRQSLVGIMSRKGLLKSTWGPGRVYCLTV